SQRTEIELVVNRFLSAMDPAKVCQTITAGLEESIKEHGAAPSLSPAQEVAPATSGCPSVISAAVKNKEFNLRPSSATIGKILVEGGRRAAALVKEPTQDQPYFLLLVSGSWLINNIGTPPPDFRALGQALQPSPSP